MAIAIKDITLEKFLEFCAPEAFPEEGKLTLSNSEFLLLASLLKLDFTIQRILRKMK